MIHSSYHVDDFLRQSHLFCLYLNKLAGLYEKNPNDYHIMEQMFGG
ncbi:hypothetical protein EDD57_101134 [Baia soyae]|uniref:Uncharacterized protein n=1 Tax=Baia soyae TaxID=1544746 RepID=A0A4V2SYJ9_9BACL|nr:hypothetical protein EDD57_101134 [Baia soyae]